MHKALKSILGDHVNQAGSLVHSDYLRFDLTHFEKITSQEIKDVEGMVNEQILLNTKLDVSLQSFDVALAFKNSILSISVPVFSNATAALSRAFNVIPGSRLGKSLA